MNSLGSTVSWGRRLESACLRIVYAFVQLLLAKQDAIGAARRRMVIFTVVALSVFVLVLVAAIPMTEKFMGKNFQAVAAVDESDDIPHLELAQNSSGGNSSPFSSLDLVQDGDESNPEPLVSEPASAERELEESTPAKKETALDHASKHADPTYVCPMHPEITSKKAGDTCPICGMTLVLVDSSSSSEGGTVQISSATMNALGVRTEPVSRRNVYRRVDTVGYITEDENSVKMINLRTEGWIEKLRVKAVGDTVVKGDLLFEVYSPMLVNAQDEYIQAMQMENSRLVRASEDRLRALGVSDRQIVEIRQNRKASQLVAIYAPQNGVVTEIRAREGMNVSPAEPVMSLVDLSKVWLVVDVFERQSDWVRVGQVAQATMPFMPGKTWKGTVEFVYPTIDPKTRSLKVRLKFDNADMALKPNMYSDVRILASPKKDVLTIPREAVIQIGKEQRVIVALGEGKFIPMPVSTGMETDDVVEVVSGLREGDEVVVSSQFLIDSEASVKAALMKMHQ